LKGLNNLDNKKAMEIMKTIDFLEEFSWFLDAKRIARLKEAPSQLRNLLHVESSGSPIDNYNKTSSPNIQFLIGILPRLFKDEILFPSNSSIIQFAEEILGIEISRHSKRSRYELIGMIICKTDELSDKKLEKLVTALSKVLNNDENFKDLKQGKSLSTFSWNDTIKKLTES
jgi:hypothetical protein